MKPPEDRRFVSLVPFNSVPFWVPSFDPPPGEDAKKDAEDLCLLEGTRFGAGEDAKGNANAILGVTYFRDTDVNQECLRNLLFASLKFSP